MPTIPLPQLIFLIAVIAGFSAFAIGLFVVQVYMLASGPDVAKPIRRQVTPAGRGGVVKPESGGLG